MSWKFIQQNCWWLSLVGVIPLTGVILLPSAFGLQPQVLAEPVNICPFFGCEGGGKFKLCIGNREIDLKTNSLINMYSTSVFLRLAQLALWDLTINQTILGLNLACSRAELWVTFCHQTVCGQGHQAICLLVSPYSIRGLKRIHTLVDRS